MAAISDLSQMIGKTLLVGITSLDSDGLVVERVQFAGAVIAVDPLVTIIRHGTSMAFTLPPSLDGFFFGVPGEYRLRDSGGIVVDPDFVTTWAVHNPAEISRSGVDGIDPADP